MNKQNNLTGKQRMQRSVWSLIICVVLMMTACGTDPYAQYQTWPEREAVLLQQQSEDGDYNELMFRWLSEPDAVNYPFDSLQAESPIRKATSPDGKLCVFSWDSYEGGIVNKWNNVIHYESDGKIHTLDQSLWSLQQDKTEAARMAIDEDGIDHGCLTMFIHQLKDTNGRTIYLTVNHLYDSMWSYTTVDAYTIVNGKLISLPEMFITANGNIRNEVEFVYEVDKWAVQTEQFLGLTSVFGFCEDEKELLVPTEGVEVAISDRFERYKFNGNKFISTDIVCGHKIHPSLQNFKEVAQLYRIGKWFIRVDEMEAGTYRYASWNVGDTAPEKIDLTRQPDLVLLNGVKVEDGENRLDEWYVFKNKNVEYRVNVLPLGTQKLEIRKDGKTILKQEQETGII